MKALLIVKTAVELLAGLSFVLAPSSFFLFLLGAPLDAVGGFAFRMFGAAIFAIGLACWLARNDSRSPAARALVMGMLFYDAAFIAVLLWARFSIGQSGVGLWPVVAVHSALAGFSILCLKPGSVVGEV